MPHRHRAGAGFTLLELLVVLAVAAIAVTVVGVGVQTYLDRARYQQTVRDLASQLRQARALSMDAGEPVLVSWRPQTRQVLVGAAPALDVPDSVVVHWQAVAPAPRPVGPAGGEAIFLFDANGGARGGQIEISRGGLGVRFQVNWLLGTIEQAAVSVPS